MRGLTLSLTTILFWYSPKGTQCIGVIEGLEKGPDVWPCSISLAIASDSGCGFECADNRLGDQAALHG